MKWVVYYLYLMSRAQPSSNAVQSGQCSTNFGVKYLFIDFVSVLLRTQEYFCYMTDVSLTVGGWKSTAIYRTE